MEPNNEKREKLKEFYYSVKNCRNCELGDTRINFVFGSGNASASILFIGEAPGKNEDLQGKPFVGQAGKILDGLLAGIGLSRNEVFIANVLKCRPPENRDPAIDEISTCKQYLFKQIEIIDPAVICTLGKYSTQLILNTTEGITKLRGNVFKINGRLVLPINHPAAALYAPSRISVLKEDFNRIKAVLDKPVPEKSVPDKPVPEKSVPDKPVPDRSVLDKPVLDKAVIDKPVPGKSALDNSTIDKAAPDKAVIPGKVLETDKVLELNAGENSTISDTNEGSAQYLKDQESINTLSYDDGVTHNESTAGSGGSKASAKEQADKNQQLGLF
jgi:uracil-DNA glycosylase family 4